MQSHRRPIRTYLLLTLVLVLVAVLTRFSMVCSLSDVVHQRSAYPGLYGLFDGIHDDSLTFNTDTSWAWGWWSRKVRDTARYHTARDANHAAIDSHIRLDPKQRDTKADASVVHIDIDIDTANARASTEPPGSIKNGRPSVGRTRTMLVLDLDETLVHTMLPSSGTTTQRLQNATVHLRPGVHQFLKKVRALFDDVVLFTAGTKNYADMVIDTYLDPSRHIFARRYYNDSCRALTEQEGWATGFFQRPRKRSLSDNDTTLLYTSATIVKDLTILKHPLTHVVIVDNTPSAYALHPSNAVPIASYMGGRDEQADTTTVTTVNHHKRCRSAVDGDGSNVRADAVTDATLATTTTTDGELGRVAPILQRIAKMMNDTRVSDWRMHREAIFSQR